MPIIKYDIKELCTLPPPYGGVTVYVKRLIGQLLKDGFTVGGYYSKSCSDKGIINSPMFDKWTWMQTGLLPIKIWKYLIETASYKIVHSHFSLEGMAYLWIMKTIGRKRIIVTVHNSMNDNYYMSTNKINRFFLHKMLQSPDVTWITVSEQGKQQLYAFPVKPVAPVYVISPYIPVQDTEYVPLCENMQQYICSHDKIIAFYGHSFMQNAGKDIYGFYTAIRVFSGIIGKTDFNVGLILCIADNSDTENIALLHEYAEKLDIDDKIFWQIGAIDNIRTLWHNTDIYIRPTSTDGDSVAVREVLDEGVTVIASDVCERPDGVITYKFGNDEELENMMLANLTVRKKDAVPDFGHYEKMKNLYSQVLNR